MNKTNDNLTLEQRKIIKYCRFYLRQYEERDHVVSKDKLVISVALRVIEKGSYEEIVENLNKVKRLPTLRSREKTNLSKAIAKLK